MIQIEHFQDCDTANNFLKDYSPSEIRDIKIFFSTQHDTPLIFIIYDDAGIKARKPQKLERPPKQIQKEEAPTLGGP